MSNPVFGKHTSETPHQLVRDNDGHWYVIPRDQHLRFRQWVEATERDGGTPDDWKYFNDECRVPGPHMVEFTAWEVR